MVCLTVQQVSGQNHFLHNVNSEISVAELKKQLEKLCNVPPRAQKLVSSGGRVLDAGSEQLSATLACCSIDSCSPLSLTMLVSLQGLCDDLLKGSEAVRLESLRALYMLGHQRYPSRICDEEVILLVLRVLAVQGQTNDVKIAAARTLGVVSEKGNLLVINAMMELLDDADGYIRVAGLEALSKVATKGDERVIAAVDAIWDDWHPSVKLAVAETMKALR
jgi:hypothetical protein